MNLTEHLKTLETSLLSPATRRNTEAVSALLTEHFREFGSSGRVYSRHDSMATLQQETPAALSLYDFQMIPLAPGAALVTYRSVKEEPGASPVTILRSSIWLQEGQNWRMLFHQGTKADS